MKSIRDQIWSETCDSLIGSPVWIQFEMGTKNRCQVETGTDVKSTSVYRKILHYHILTFTDLHGTYTIRYCRIRYYWYHLCRSFVSDMSNFCILFSFAGKFHPIILSFLGLWAGLYKNEGGRITSKNAEGSKGF